MGNYPEYYPVYLLDKTAELIGAGQLDPKVFVEDVKNVIAARFKNKIADISEEEISKTIASYPEVSGEINVNAYKRGAEIIENLVKQGELTEKELQLYFLSEAYETWKNPEVRKWAEEVAPAPNADERVDLHESTKTAPGPAGNVPQTTPSVGSNTEEEAAAKGEQMAVTEMTPEQAQAAAGPAEPTAQAAAVEAQVQGAQASTTNYDGYQQGPPQAAVQQAAQQEVVADGIDAMFDQFADNLADLIIAARVEHASTSAAAILTAITSAIDDMAKIAVTIVQNGGGAEDIAAAAQQLIHEIDAALNAPQEQGQGNATDTEGQKAAEDSYGYWVDDFLKEAALIPRPVGKMLGLVDILKKPVTALGKPVGLVGSGIKRSAGFVGAGAKKPIGLVSSGFSKAVESQVKRYWPGDYLRGVASKATRPVARNFMAAGGLAGLAAGAGVGAYAMHKRDQANFEARIPEIADMVGPNEYEKIKALVQRAYTEGYQRALKERRRKR